MTSPTPSSNTPSGAATPNSRFTTQASTAADLLATQTVGLVHLSDFRKRRAEALEQKEREASGGGSLRSYGRFAPAAAASAPASGAATPNSNDGVSTPHGPPPKKKRKAVAKGKLSFGVEDEEHGDGDSNAASKAETPASNISDEDHSTRSSRVPPHNGSAVERKRIGPNANITVAPKAMTKSALLQEAQTREQLRKEFLIMQEIVKATEVIIPFVFYDGTNIPGGACKVKKGDYIWLFLDRSRKVGAELGVGGAGGGGGGGGGEKTKSRNEWARVGVDDLMLVRGEIIIPHHYELYYFIVNKNLGPNSIPLFDYSSTATTSRSTSPAPGNNNNNYDPISLHPSSKSSKKSTNTGQVTAADRNNLEGVNDDPSFTKVVDRRWYERNKHIFPASVWEEFDPGKDYAKGVRKDAEGNAFFFS